MGLAVISGLVDDVEVIAGEHGGVIRMTWPTRHPPRLLHLTAPSYDITGALLSRALGVSGRSREFVNEFTINA